MPDPLRAVKTDKKTPQTKLGPLCDTFVSPLGPLKNGVTGVCATLGFGGDRLIPSFRKKGSAFRGLSR
jgi:hypothetical protein